MEISLQTLNEKILPKPNIQANKPKIITPNFRVNIFCSSTHAVKGSISDTEELTAAIEIKIKKIEEKMLPKGKELKAIGKVSNNNNSDSWLIKTNHLGITTEIICED